MAKRHGAAMLRMDLRMNGPRAEARLPDTRVGES
jgi:hypothetical protein